MLDNAKVWSFYCKTWHSEYSNWLTPVAFWQHWSTTNSFSAGAMSRTPLRELTALPRPSSWFKGSLLLRGGKIRGGGRGGEAGWKRGGAANSNPGSAPASPRQYNSLRSTADNAFRHSNISSTYEFRRIFRWIPRYIHIRTLDSPH